MLSMRPTNGNYYTCPINKSIQTRVAWHFYIWTTTGFQGRSGKMVKILLVLSCPALHAHIPFPRAQIEVQSQLVPGAPPGGDCGDIGHAHLGQAS